MAPVFRQDFPVSDIHLDCFRRVKPSVLLYFAQEIAGQHCLELGVDWDTLARQHMFWAVIRQRFQITRLPTAGETVTVETWPMPTTRTAFPRATVGYDENGKELFRALGLWVLMHTDTRAMILPGKSGVLVDGISRGGELAAPGSIAPRILQNHIQKTVGFTELDRNGHMNNTRYMDWIDDLLPSTFHREHPVREFTVCYLTEAREGQRLDLNWALEDGLLHVDAHRQNPTDPNKQDRVFAAQVRF